jgi:ribonuclease D
MEIIIAIYTYYNDLPDDFTIDGDIAIDTEAMGLNNHRDRLCLLQFSNGDDNAHLVQFSDKKYNSPNLSKLLSDETRCKIFHYARFDIAIINKYLNIYFNNIFCTKIASKLARTYTDSHGLKELCRELLGIQISKQQQSSDWGNENLTKDQLEYAANDVIYLHKLRLKLIYMLEREKRYNIAKQCFEFLPTRVELDLLGWNEIDIFSH